MKIAIGNLRSGSTGIRISGERGATVIRVLKCVHTGK